MGRQGIAIKLAVGTLLLKWTYPGRSETTIQVGARRLPAWPLTASAHDDFKARARAPARTHAAGVCYSAQAAVASLVLKKSAAVSTSAVTKRPRVAIIVVNGFARRGARGQQRAAEAVEYPWIELCLRQITRYSQGWDYQVFIFDNSHLKSHRRLMRKFERVHVLPGNWVAILGRIANRLPSPYLGRLLERRHPSALDHLAKKVPAAFDYIVTLDNDSFPVRDDWLDVLVSECERGAALAGVYRDEMAPSVDPFVHVSGLCVARDDLRALGVSFGRDIQYIGEQYKQDVDHNQDVGQKITYEFIRLGRRIAPLERSNKVNYHFVMGGVYGDVIYHHGAGGRRAKFRQAGDVADDERISTALRDAAFQDVDHLVAVLRGQAANDLELTPL